MTSYERVTIGDVDYEDPFAGIATIRAYETDSEGNPSMLKQFYETQKDVMDGAQKRYTFVALDGTEQTFTCLLYTSCIWERNILISCEFNLDSFLWMGNGSWKYCLRVYVVYHDCRNPVWKTIL